MEIEKEKEEVNKQVDEHQNHEKADEHQNHEEVHEHQNHEEVDEHQNHKQENDDEEVDEHKNHEEEDADEEVEEEEKKETNEENNEEEDKDAIEQPTTGPRRKYIEHLKQKHKRTKNLRKVVEKCKKEIDNEMKKLSPNKATITILIKIGDEVIYGEKPKKRLQKEKEPLMLMNGMIILNFFFCVAVYN